MEVVYIVIRQNRNNLSQLHNERAFKDMHIAAAKCSELNGKYPEYYFYVTSVELDVSSSIYHLQYPAPLLDRNGIHVDIDESGNVHLSVMAHRNKDGQTPEVPQ